MRSRADYLEAQYKLLRDAGHDSCARKLLRDDGDDLCDACEAECECCGDAIAYTPGRDESIKTAVLCTACTEGCQGCCRLLGAFFGVDVWVCASGERQLLPLCYRCADVNVMEVEEVA